MTMKINVNEIKILSTVVQILYPKYHAFWFILYMYICYQKILKRKLKYVLKNVQIDFIKTIIKNKKYLGDLNSTVIVHPDNVYPGDKVLRLYSEENKFTRIVYPVSSLLCPKNKLLISDTLFYNLQHFKTKDDLRLLSYNTKYIKIASEINISLISSPFDISNSTLDAVLERFFKIPKLICKSDLIEIDVKYFAEDAYLLNSKLHGVDSIFFKCNKITYEHKEVDGQYFCVIGETAVRQDVNIQGYLPKKIFKTIVDSKNRLKRLPLVPYGLQGYFEDIQFAVRPFFRKAKLPLKPVFQIIGNAGSGKELLVSALADSLGMHYYVINNFELMASTYAQNESKLHNTFFNAKMAAPCVISMHNFENFGKNNDGQFDERIMGHFADELGVLFENNQFPVVLFCCTDQKTTPSDLQKVFLESFEIKAPNEKEREDNLRWIYEDQDIVGDVNFNDIANKTHGFFFEDLKALVYYAVKNSRKNVDLKNTVTNQNFMQAIEYMQKNYNESIGAPKVPKVLWSDVGGLSDVKEEIIKTINLPLKHPELIKKTGLKSSGILLFGPPGTGKTLIAKAVATECSLCFLSVKGPELLNMYVGQSEQNIREVFERAREASPCIIFFDELDSLAPNRGLSGDSGGVMDRVVSQLLAEMDGLNESVSIFIIGATNRPDLIDPALLRPGRFDKLLYIGPCTDDDSKISVLKALTNKFKLEKDVDLTEVVKVCPKNITGADFYGICSNAWLSAVRRLVNKIETSEVSADEVSSEDVIVNFDDFKRAMVDVKPSISPQDLLYFEKLKNELCSNS